MFTLSAVLVSSHIVITVQHMVLIMILIFVFDYDSKVTSIQNIVLKFHLELFFTIWIVSGLCNNAAFTVEKACVVDHRKSITQAHTFHSDSWQIIQLLIVLYGTVKRSAFMQWQEIVGPINTREFTPTFTLGRPCGVRNLSERGLRMRDQQRGSSLQSQEEG